MKKFDDWDDGDDLRAARGVFNAVIISLAIAGVIAIILSLCECSSPLPVGYNTEDLAKGAARMEEVRRNLHTLDDARGFLSFFEYVPSPLYRMPSIEEVFTARLHGDCKTAAVLSCWTLCTVGIPAHIYELTGGGWKYPHTVTVSDDHGLFATNDISGYGGVETIRVIAIDAANWEREVLGWFRPPYQKMKLVK
jgi:hypothetical protein